VRWNGNPNFVLNAPIQTGEQDSIVPEVHNQSCGPRGKGRFLVDLLATTRTGMGRFAMRNGRDPIDGFRQHDRGIWKRKSE